MGFAFVLSESQKLSHLEEKNSFKTLVLSQCSGSGGYVINWTPLDPADPQSWILTNFRQKFNTGTVFYIIYILRYLRTFLTKNFQMPQSDKTVQFGSGNGCRSAIKDCGSGFVRNIYKSTGLILCEMLKWWWKHAASSRSFLSPRQLQHHSEVGICCQCSCE
jgi:hypothetical protein